MALAFMVVVSSVLDDDDDKDRQHIIGKPHRSPKDPTASGGDAARPRR